MDWQSIQPLFDWLSDHSVLAGIFVFLIAFTESLLIIGLIVPGTVLMFGVGTLVGAGALDIWDTLVIAFLGAVAGDAVSFYIGKHYYDEIIKFWPFNKHPDYVEKGKHYFEKHGGKSILIGRFVGPVRPIIPAVAGMMGMSQSYFFTVNIISAAGWAPFYLIPGIVFGSSLSLAAAVGSRLVFVLVFVFCAIIVLAWIGKFVYKYSLPRLQRRFLTWIEKSPSKPLVQLMFDNAVIQKNGSFLLLVLFGFMLAFVFAFIANSKVIGVNDLDQIVNRLVIYLQSQYFDIVFNYIYTVFSWPLTVLLTVNACILFIYKGNKEIALRYLLIILFTLVTVLTLELIKLVWGVDIQQNYSILLAITNIAGLLVFAFVLIKIAEQNLGYVIKIVTISSAFILLLLIALANIYLDIIPLSSLILLFCISFFWIVLLLWGGIFNISPRVHNVLFLSTLIFVLIVSGLSVKNSDQFLEELIEPEIKTTTIDRDEWYESKWNHFDDRKIGILGETPIRFNIQWNGSREKIFEYLISSGWALSQNLDLQNTLIWLNPEVSLTELGEFPQSHFGRKTDFVFYKYSDSDKNRRLALRFWRQDVEIDGDDLWLVSFVEEVLEENSLIVASITATQNNEMLLKLARKFRPAWSTHLVYDKDQAFDNDQRLLLTEFGG